LAGALGAAVLDFTLEKRWARRGDGRLIVFSPSGAEAFWLTLICGPTGATH
jgi:hypothetical protein